MHKSVLLDCERMKYPYTGLYYFCLELGNALLQENHNQFNFSFYVPEEAKEIFGNHQKYLIQKYYDKYLTTRLSGYDIWHSTYQGTNYLPSKKNKLKIIATIHDLNFLHEFKEPARLKYYLNKTQALINKADRIVAISHFVKNEILTYLDAGDKNIEVIYNGRNAPKSNDFIKPTGDYNRPFFFTLGTIARKKNFHILPALLLNNDYNLIIAGITQDEHYKQRVIEEAHKQGVEDRVKIIGPVTEEEKYWLIKNCVLFCFPSVAEGFGLPVIEAMQLGSPVLLSKHTSLPEIGGPYALYLEDFSPEAVSKAAEDFLSAAFTNEQKENLIKWAHLFDWRKTAERYLAIYNSLI